MMSATAYALPIIVVPGIMGTRLKNSELEDIVWDPPDLDFSWGNPDLPEPPEGWRKYSPFHIFKHFLESGYEIVKEAVQENIGEVSKIYNVLNVFTSSAEQKRKVIGDATFKEGFLEVDQGNQSQWERVIHKPFADAELPTLDPEKKVTPYTLTNRLQPWRKRGWGEVHWGSYGSTLEYLEKWAKNMCAKGNCHIYMPVYACGYNWSDSNANSSKRLAERIDEAIDECKALGFTQQGNIKVLVVTHSMGGFVTRYCSVVDGYSSKIHSIIHTAMPTHGSPATYKRMRVGFEGITKFILGRSGPVVTAQLAHMPGGLELLPNTIYQQSKCATNPWLKVSDHQGEEALFKTDPYKEVYLNEKDWWRLIADKAWVAPEAKNEAEALTLYYQGFVLQLGKALKFHDDLKDTFHARTCLAYSVSQSHLAWDVIEWQISGSATAKEVTADDSRDSFDLHSYTLTSNGKVTYYNRFDQQTLFGTRECTEKLNIKIADPVAAGDGTVHKGAGACFEVPLGSYGIDSSEEHQYFLLDKNVRLALVSQIEDELIANAPPYKRVDPPFKCDASTDCVKPKSNAKFK